MNYERILKMNEELREIKSDFVSISKDDYNNLLKISNEGFTCIDIGDEVELDTNDLKNLVRRCINFYEN